MMKEEKEYNEKYGDISTEYISRIDSLLQGNFKKYRGNIMNEMRRIMNIKWNRLDITIYMIPKATPRPRVSGNGRVFYVKNASNNRKRFKKFMDRENLPQIQTPVKFYCTSYLPIPSSMNKLESVFAEMGLIYPISKPDWDNLGKTYSDMIQERLLLDDSLIVKGVSTKKYSTKPRIEITLFYMDEFDSQFNKKKIQKIIDKE